VKYLNIVLAAGGEGTEPAASGGGLGIGAVALILVVALLLVWMAYLVLNSRRSRAASREAAPPNQSQGISDDELENRKLTRVLRAALFGSILMAVIMPWYALNEPGRQEAFAESTSRAARKLLRNRQSRPTPRRVSTGTRRRVSLVRTVMGPKVSEALPSSSKPDQVCLLRGRFLRSMMCSSATQRKKSATGSSSDVRVRPCLPTVSRAGEP